MAQAPRPGRDAGATIAQLKEGIAGNIAAGKEKVFDPAAAPLGTDDEAGGASPHPKEVALAQAREAPPDGDRVHSQSPHPRHGWRPYGIYACGAAGVLLMGILLFLAR